MHRRLRPQPETAEEPSAYDARDGADRGLRADRRPPDRRPRRASTARSTGAASPASTPAPASLRCSGRPSTGAGSSPRRGRRALRAAIPPRHARSRDAPRDDDGHRPGDRLHAPARARRPISSGSSRASTGRCRCATELVIRFDYGRSCRGCVASTTRGWRSPVPTRSASGHRSSRRRGPDDRGGVHGRPANGSRSSSRGFPPMRRCPTRSTPSRRSTRPRRSGATGRPVHPRRRTTSEIHSRS